MAQARNAHVVAYDVVATSPAQPRVRVWIDTLRQCGLGVTLWTERPPGDWAAQVGAVVVVVADPVRRAYERFGGWRASGSHAARTTAAAEQDGRSGGAMRALVGVGSGIGRSLQRRLSFPDPEVWWSRLVARRLAKRAERGDLVTTHTRPESVVRVGFGAQRIGCLWHLDLQDGWTYKGLREDAMRPGARREREIALERRAVEQADVVSTVDDDLAAHARVIGGDREVVVFPNLIPNEMLVEPGTARRRPESSDPTVRFVYLGRVSGSDPKRSLAPFRRLLALSCSDVRISVDFFGEYGERDRAEFAEIQGLGIDVAVHGPVPRHDLALRSADYDATLVVTSPGQGGSSSKLLDALGLCLPVFAFAGRGSVLENILERTAAGVAVGFEAPEREHAVAWNTFLKRVRSGACRVDSASRAPYTSSYAVAALRGRIQGLLASSGRTQP